MDIYTVKLSECQDVDFGSVQFGISEQRKEKLNSIRDDMNFKRSLAGDLLIRDVLRQNYGYSEERLYSLYNSYGKPYIEGVYFNISHSEDYVVCAVSDTEVGIDIEHIRPVDFIVAENFFSNEEKQRLYGFGKDDGLKYFYTVWTAKESYIKKNGRGIDFDLRNITTLFKDHEICIFKNDIDTGCLCYTVTIDDNYIMTLCSDELISDIVINKWTF